MAQGLLATRKRRIVGRRERLPGHGPSGPGFGGGGLRGKRRTGEWRSEATGIATRRRWRDHGSGLVSPPARRVRWACVPPCSSAKGRRSLPARERRSGSGFAGFLPGASRWPGKCFRRMQWGLPWGLPCRPRPGSVPKASDVDLPKPVERRCGPAKGPTILSRSVPDRQVRRHRPRRGDLLRAAYVRPSRPRLMRRRVVPRPGHAAAGILPLRPAPHSIWGPVRIPGLARRAPRRPWHGRGMDNTKGPYY